MMVLFHRSRHITAFFHGVCHVRRHGGPADRSHERVRKPPFLFICIDFTQKKHLTQKIFSKNKKIDVFIHFVCFFFEKNICLTGTQTHPETWRACGMNTCKRGPLCGRRELKSKGDLTWPAPPMPRCNQPSILTLFLLLIC